MRIQTLKYRCMKGGGRRGGGWWRGGTGREKRERVEEGSVV